MEEKLYQACSNGKVEEVQKLLQNEQININWQNQNDYLQTPFHSACERGHIDIVELLLNDNRIDFSKGDNNGYTPFHTACEKGHFEIVKLLLNDQRIDINKASNSGWTPFYRACYNGHIDIVKLLLNDDRSDLNKTTNDGSTPFLIACYNGKTEVVKYLLESGREIDINKKDSVGKSGLDYAKQKGNTDIIKLIESNQLIIEDGKKYNKIENEEQKRKEAESKRVTFEIEHNTNFYQVKTTATTLLELENDIKSKLKIESNEFVLEFKEENKGKYMTLQEDDMEDLEDGMTIKVSTVSTQLY